MYMHMVFCALVVHNSKFGYAPLGSGGIVSSLASVQPKVQLFYPGRQKIYLNCLDSNED